MATDPRKRQKKLERRNSKRQEKKHHLVRAARRGRRALAAATKYPVLNRLDHRRPLDARHGLGAASRQMPDGSVAVVVFLIDRYCLGVKDALADVVGRYSYDKDFVTKMQSKFTSREVSPATVRKLVEEAVAYAAGLGFAPHADYHKAKPIFGTIDPRESTEEFEFGKDGKPFFIAGPNDTPQRCRQIMAVLAHDLGPDGFHYLIPMATGDEVFPDALQMGHTPLIGEDEDEDVGDDTIDLDDEASER